MPGRDSNNPPRIEGVLDFTRAVYADASDRRRAQAEIIRRPEREVHATLPPAERPTAGAVTNREPNLPEGGRVQPPEHVPALADDSRVSPPEHTPALPDAAPVSAPERESALPVDHRVTPAERTPSLPNDNRVSPPEHTPALPMDGRVAPPEHTPALPQEAPSPAGTDRAPNAGVETGEEVTGPFVSYAKVEWRSGPATW